MFEELLGLPAHPLLIHAAVVFVPLLIAASAAYAVVPFVRRWIAWAVVGLAVIAPFAIWFATLSGNALRERLLHNGATPEGLVLIDEHRGYGQTTLWWTIALAVLAVLLVATVVMRQRRASESSNTPGMVATVVLAIAVLGVAGVTGYYIFKTGDTGAHSVWGNI